MNTSIGEVIHDPAQDLAETATKIDQLAQVINDDNLSTLDPQVKMAVIQQQLGSVHPVSDGNGRVGRILGVLDSV